MRLISLQSLNLFSVIACIIGWLFDLSMELGHFMAVPVAHSALVHICLLQTKTLHGVRPTQLVYDVLVIRFVSCFMAPIPYKFVETPLTLNFKAGKVNQLKSLRLSI